MYDISIHLEWPFFSEWINFINIVIQKMEIIVIMIIHVVMLILSAFFLSLIANGIFLLITILFTSVILFLI